MVLMKKKPALFLNILLLLFILFSMDKPLHSQAPMPSRFKGKTIVRVDFIGKKRLTDGKEEDIAIRNLDQSDLEAYVLTEKGYPLDPEVITADINALFKEADLLDVRAEVTEFGAGVAVRFIVIERPVVYQILFKGMDEIAETDFTEEIPVKVGEAYREQQIPIAEQIIRERYISEGFFNVVVTTRIDHVDDEKNNDVTVSFRIDEGEDIGVQKITLLGTHKLGDDKLRSVMETKEESFFSESQFSVATYEADKQKILIAYRQEGYLDADIVDEKVVYDWVNPNNKEERGIYITLRISEGERYFFEKYTIEGNSILSTKRIMDLFELRHKEETPVTRMTDKIVRFFGGEIENDTVCNDTLFQMDRYNLAFEYGKQGYLFTRILPEKNIIEREVVVDGKKEIRKYVHYHLTIAEGTQSYIENILIRGNDKTKDHVIRREVLFNEKELYNSEKIQTTREILFRLGYFEEVNIDIRPGSSGEKVNIIISVVEQNTGTLSLGGGFSSDVGFSVFASVAEKNLFGYGYSAELKVEYGEFNKSATITFTDPWLTTINDNPVSLTASIFYSLQKIRTVSIFPDTSEDERAYYEKQTLGYSLGLGYRFWIYHSVGTIWSHSFKTVINPSGNASEEVMRLEEIGLQEKRKLTLYTSYNSTDSYMNPTKGLSAYMGVSMVGGVLLWGDDHFVKVSPKIEWFKSPFTLPYLKDYPCVIQLRANAHFMMPPVGDSIIARSQPANENPWIESEDRLFLGGPETLRIWDYYDKDLPLSWRNRLFHQITYGAEFRVPVHPQYFWVALFFDSGALYSDQYWDDYSEYSDDIYVDKDNGDVVDIRDIHTVNPLKYFRYSYGFGFRVQIPMLPMRFWFGKKALWEGLTEGGLKPLDGFEFQLQLGDIRY